MPRSPPALQLGGGSEEGETWGYLAAHFAGDGRTFLLERLGLADCMPPSAADATAAAEEPPAADGAADAAAAPAAVGGMHELSLGPGQGSEAAALAAQLLAGDGDGADFFTRSSAEGACVGGLRRSCCLAVQPVSCPIFQHHRLTAFLPSCFCCCDPSCLPADGGAFFDNLTTPASGAAQSPTSAHGGAASGEQQQREGGKAVWCGVSGSTLSETACVPCPDNQSTGRLVTT